MGEQTKKLSREEQAKLEIGQTSISPAVKWALVLVGLATLYAVPVVQGYLEWQGYREGLRPSPWPQCIDIVPALCRAAKTHYYTEGGFFQRVFRANAAMLREINQYEEDLKAESFLSQWLLPPTQALLVLVGCGNEQGYIGRERWLFYRPGIDYCTGPGFLAPRQMKRRADSGSEWRAPPQPDPRQAVLQFHHQLAARGIRLILMPVPDKATIHPEKFSRRYEHWSGPPIHNSSYERFIADVQQAGVQVCDVSKLLWEQKQRSGAPVFLATDTHWRPEAMELAAAELARLIRQHVPLDGPNPLSAGGSGVGGEGIIARYLRRELQMSNLGDIAVMLRLPEKQRIFAPEEVVVHPVVAADGRAWQPDPNAAVLLLGDSFSNIYSHELMNWGSGAGLAEQLSFALQWPVDAIIQNDNGAYATRATLAEELAKGQDRLAGKKVVVWQFAVRELAVGDWKLMEMQLKAGSPVPPTTPSTTPSTTTPTEEQPEELVVVGTVAAKSPAPRAGTVTYADHIFTIDLEVEEVLSGKLTEKRIPVYLFSMRQQKNTPAFSWAIGQRVKLRLQPWEPEWKKKYGQLNRTRTEDFDLLEAKHWWGEVVE